MAAKPLDEELKKAFTELHERSLETKQKLQVLNVQIETLSRTKQHAELTQLEISKLPPNTKTFEPVGRMFLLQDIDTIKADLEKRTKIADEKIKSYKNNKEYLQQNLKEFEDNIREMVQKKLHPGK